ncbi:MAG: penicillin-binding protein activator LpoB [Kiritimatiellaeota bacterium]|nr:penicillin-binding protein activator LpoB [Kiritimatiellota bacterium]
MKNMIYMPLLAFAGALTLITGCATTPVTREVTLDRQPRTASKLEAQDTRRAVEKMVEAMLQDIDIDELREDHPHLPARPVVDFFAVKNATSGHVDTKSFTDSLRVALLKSRKFRFVDRTRDTETIDEMRRQARGGLVDPDKAIAAGQQIAAQMQLMGRVMDDKTKVGRTTDVYYKFTLELLDMTSGEIVWADEHELRKETTRPIF